MPAGGGAFDRSTAISRATTARSTTCAPLATNRSPTPEPARASERTDDATADNVRQAAEQGANRSAKGDKRRRDDGEEHVLDHVHAEELGREQIDPRDEREENREESRKEECRPPDRPPPAHTPHAGGVNERREGHRRD